MAALLAAAVLLLIGGLQILRSRDVATDDARKDARNLSASAAQQAARSIESVALVLGNVVDRLESDPDRIKLHPALQRQHALLPELHDLVVTDASGAVLAQAAHSGSTSLADRSCFAWHRLHDDRAMHIDATATETEVPTLSLTRRYNNPDGSFAGVVVGMLDLSGIRGFYKALNIGEGGALGLWTLDGQMVLRQPPVAGPDRSFRSGTMFRLAREAASGLFVGTSVVDGVDRFIAFDRLDRYPSIVATAASSVDEVMAPWRHEALVQAGIVSIAALSLLGVGVALELRNRLARISADVLARSEARYRMLAEAATDMIVLADMDGVRRYVSPASLDLLGYPPEDLVGRRPDAMIHPDDAERFGAMMAALRAGRQDAAASTHRMLRNDGSYIWVEAKVRLVRAGDGRPGSVVAAVRDVSARQSQSDDLRRAKEEAEAATGAKSEFLAGMSHELRTPLNSVIGFSDLMLSGGDLPSWTMKRYARLIRDASATLLAIVNDVLDMSKIEAGGLELEATRFSPRDVVQSATSMLGEQARAKGLGLTVAIDPDVPDALVGDDNRLRQVLLNLLSNAVKFTAAGSVSVAVAALGVAGGRAKLRFAVADTGIGIPPDKRHRLFQRFSQVDASTARRFGGSGLGLSICRSLVVLMGGDMQVTSSEGEGSTFSFELTFPVAAPTLLPLEPAPGPCPRSARILLAEDTPMNQELMVAVLNGLGHVVEVVADGAAALAAVRRPGFDLVLMDMQMPVMDGIEAIGRIRALGGRFATLPIIALTANVETKDTERCRLAGATAHLGKPFRPERLQALIGDILRDQDAEPRARRAG